jgi:hypothetical protein
MSFNMLAATKTRPLMQFIATMKLGNDPISTRGTQHDG